MKIIVKKILSIVGWLVILVVTFLVFTLLYGAGTWWSDLVSNTGAKMAIHMGMALLILAIYAGLRRLKEKKWPSDLTIRQLLPYTISGMGVGIAYFCIVVITMAIIGIYRIDHAQFPTLELATMFIQFLLVAVGEEVMFRGILFRMINNMIGTKTALVVSALIFGFAHFMQGTWWSSIAIAIEAGLLLAMAYQLTHSLWFPIGIHWTWNFMQGNVFGFMVSGTDSGASIITPSIEGHELLTGGAFGAEASILAVILGAALTWFMYQKSKDSFS